MRALWEAQRVGRSALMGLTRRSPLCGAEDKGVGPKKGEKLKRADRQLDWGWGRGVAQVPQGGGAGRGRKALRGREGRAENCAGPAGS